MTDSKQNDCQTKEKCDERHRRGWIRASAVWGSIAGLLILAISISVSASTEAARATTQQRHLSEAIESLHADVREMRATQVEMLRNGRRGD